MSFNSRISGQRPAAVPQQPNQGAQHVVPGSGRDQAIREIAAPLQRAGVDVVNGAPPQPMQFRARPIARDQNTVALVAQDIPWDEQEPIGGPVPVFRTVSGYPDQVQGMPTPLRRPPRREAPSQNIGGIPVRRTEPVNPSVVYEVNVTPSRRPLRREAPLDDNVGSMPVFQTESANPSEVYGVRATSLQQPQRGANREQSARVRREETRNPGDRNFRLDR